MKNFLKKLSLFTQTVSQTLISTFGSRYIEKFKEEEVIGRKELDLFLEEIYLKNKGLIIAGNVGVGKTMSLIYLYKKLIEKMTLRILETGDIFSLQPSKTSSKIAVFFAPQLFDMLHNDERILIAEYIFIDDLGREYAEPFALSRFEVFVENIYKNKNLILVLTTNLKEEQFKNRDGWARIMIDY